MPRGKVAKARKDTETTSPNKLDPNLTTTTKPRRSPRNHASSETAAKTLPPLEGNQQSTIGNHITSKKTANVRNTTTLRSAAEATVASKAAVKPSQGSKDKANAAVQSKRQTSGRANSAHSVPPSSPTHHVSGRDFYAKSKKRAGREPGRSACRQRTERQSGKADASRKTSSTGRDAQKKVSSKSIAELIPAPLDDGQTSYATEPELGPIEEDEWASGSGQLLTREALEELDRRLESIDSINRNGSAEESEEGSSQGSAIGSQERFNRNWGYVPPLDEETKRIIKAIIKNPARAETMIGISPEDPEFLFGLDERNVLSDPSTRLDPCLDEIQSISVEGYLQETQEEKISHEMLWKSDKAKCNPGSTEALYQRTLMMDLIARHILIYQLNSNKEQIFDFSVEEPWGCPPMPSRLLYAIPKGLKPDAKFLTQPKPNLAIYFRREAVISDSMWKTLPDGIKRLACFEDCYWQESRVFHFLAVQSGKAIFDLDSPPALHQCLNNASQALHNMYEFFRDAGPEHERAFYDKVRFFSIVTNRKGMIIRIHRAIRKPDDTSRYGLVMPDRPDYRLEFEFREFQRIGDGNEFSRKSVLEVMKKILKYATDDLSKMINAAASTLVERIEKDHELYFARCEADFYSYGQPNPKNFKSSRHTSVVPPTVNDWMQRECQIPKLGPNCAPSDQQMASGQPVISSPLANTSKKRGVEEMDSDELENMQALNAPVRKRLKATPSEL